MVVSPFVWLFKSFHGKIAGLWTGRFQRACPSIVLPLRVEPAHVLILSRFRFPQVGREYS
jgi:hypothetical protein